MLANTKNKGKAKRLNAEVGSASHKSGTACARATTLKILRRKRFRKPKK